MRCLVTGGAGFIGSHLCDALIERECQVCCVDNLHLGRMENIAHLLDNRFFHFRKLDLLDREALGRLFDDEPFDVVFHLAANSDIQAGTKDYRIDLELNLLTTCEVLNAMRQHSVSEIVFASTSAIFGDTPATLHEEFGPLRPVSSYGASKLAAESFISVFVNNHGFTARIARFPNVVGERATHGAIYDFIKRLRADPTHLVVLGDGSQSKPYIYVGDLVTALLLVFDKGERPLGVYHIGNEGLTSVSEMAAIVLQEMGVANVPIQYTGGKIGWVGDVPRFQYDYRKISALGFHPRFTSTAAVREAVRRILGRPTP